MPNSFPILVEPPSTARSTAKLMKTGQPTSYRTGDDGDIEAGRAVSFFVLAENNPFGNTNRFTDELGGQTYTNNIVIDWSTYDGSTVLGWYRVVVESNVTWANAIDAALATSVGGFNSGWYLPNLYELMSIVNLFANTARLNYAPFNITNTYIWTSTTVAGNITQAFRLDNTNVLLNLIGSSGKSADNPFRYIPVRNFTVTGITLT